MKKIWLLFRIVTATPVIRAMFAVAFIQSLVILLGIWAYRMVF